MFFKYKFFQWVYFRFCVAGIMCSVIMPIRNVFYYTCKCLQKKAFPFQFHSEAS